MRLNWNYAPEQAKGIAESYHRQGAVVVHGLIELDLIERFRADIGRLLEARIRSLGRQPQPTEDIDVAYAQLNEIDEKHTQELILAVRDLPVYYSLINHPRIQELARAILGDTVFQIVHDICLFRIDPAIPGHPRLFDWHTDYPYNVLSRSAITLWVPLTDIEDDMGPLKVVLGSHDRIHAVEFREEFAKPGRGTGHKVFALRDDEREKLEAESTEIKGVRAGDALILSSCLLHSSGQNSSPLKRSRWVFNIRIGDLLDEQVVQRGWKVVRDRNPYVFPEVHPDLTRVIR
jgi:hypothetical protein